MGFNLRSFFLVCLSYQAWRAQIGSISVTQTMAPSAFRAEQQPFPTYTRISTRMKIKPTIVMLIVNKVWQLSEIKRLFFALCRLSRLHCGAFYKTQMLTDLSVTTNHHLLPTKHHICCSLQTKKKEEVNHDYTLW